ncbi:hypothetical protein CPLU01_06518 [Colletotrichum plurivorum]|uniref:Uncharacterized protein n=1 Tax=Colletotrichum plurivorum TaxID=2175906 RepID=A0A8H6KI05_9PEZI|nr:hypothetical protein CPLU01_06518 [Colletotrichum plurivorum]
MMACCSGGGSGRKIKFQTGTLDLEMAENPTVLSKVGQNPTGGSPDEGKSHFEIDANSIYLPTYLGTDSNHKCALYLAASEEFIDLDHLRPK